MIHTDLCKTVIWLTKLGHRLSEKSKKSSSKGYSALNHSITQLCNHFFKKAPINLVIAMRVSNPSISLEKGRQTFHAPLNKSQNYWETHPCEMISRKYTSVGRLSPLPLVPYPCLTPSLLWASTTSSRIRDWLPFLKGRSSPTSLNSLDLPTFLSNSVKLLKT